MVRKGVGSGCDQSKCGKMAKAGEIETPFCLLKTQMFPLKMS